MILTCPQCSSRFLLSALALAPEGRRVKCSNCSEIWFHKPDVTEIDTKDHKDNSAQKPPMEIDMLVDFEEIPDSVKPLPEGSNTPVIPKNVGRKIPLNVLAGYAGALAVFICVFALLVNMRQFVVDAWLPSAGFYKKIGAPVVIPGEGLMFDAVDVTAEKNENKERITIKGRILNVADRARDIPALEAEIRDTESNVIGRLPIPLSAAQVETGQGVDFEASFTPDVTNIGEVRLHFVLGVPVPRTAAAGDGNNPAPAQDGEIPPHDSEGGA